ATYSAPSAPECGVPEPAAWRSADDSTACSTSVRPSPDRAASTTCAPTSRRPTDPQPPREAPAEISAGASSYSQLAALSHARTLTAGEMTCPGAGARAPPPGRPPGLPVNACSSRAEAHGSRVAAGHRAATRSAL